MSLDLCAKEQASPSIHETKAFLLYGFSDLIGISSIHSYLLMASPHTELMRPVSGKVTQPVQLLLIHGLQSMAFSQARILQ